MRRFSRKRAVKRSLLPPAGTVMRDVLCDGGYGVPRSRREELVVRIANLRMRRWSDRDDAAELEEQLAEAERELRALDRGRGG
jgi:hypothetical protein